MGTTTHLAPPEVSVALQGTLDTFALPDVLRLLAATKKSGRLRLDGDRGTGDVWVNGGAVAAVEASRAPRATEAVDALFELLRFDEGSFTFDADAVHDGAAAALDVEALLDGAEAQLREWREIESIVPSLDAWVTLRRTLPEAEVIIDQDRWTTLVAVGGGATVGSMGHQLGLSELPVSRAVRDLVELGLVDLTSVAPVPTPSASVVEPDEEPAAVTGIEVVSVDEETAEASEDEPLGAPLTLGQRQRRSRAMRAAGTSRDEPETFVPLDLPQLSHESTSYDPVEPEPELRGDDAEAEERADELERQLATLSPKAAEAVRAAAAADTDAEREAALAEVIDGEAPLNRGLLLKFLSSVKG